MSASESPKVKELYEFGPFRVDPEKEILLRAGEPVPLTPKTFQILLVLLRHSQEIVTKDDLMKAVWPDTFVEEANLSRNIFMLRKALGDGEENNRYIITVPGRGYRLAETVRVLPEQEVRIVAAQHSTVQVEVKETKPSGWIVIAVAGIVLFGAFAVAWRFFGHRRVLTETDTIVLADFANSTGDPVFDGTLRQGLAVQLEQSPFLDLVSDARVQQTLLLMGQPADAQLTPAMAYDLCQRTQSAAVIDGSIANLGNQYVVGVRALSCRTGDPLVEEQERATGKEQILTALDKAAVRLRARLGESAASLKRFDTPLEQATTPSLDALQAYSLGRKNMVGRGDFPAAVPFFQRAIRLDPNFAQAYAALGSVYWNLGDTTLGAEYGQKGFELRSRVSELEGFYIESTYYHYVTGDLEKARQVYEVSAQTFPRYPGSRIRLGILYTDLGQHEKALVQFREALRLDSSWAINYGNLMGSYINLNRLPEALAVARAGQAEPLDSRPVRSELYWLAFLSNDAAGMAEQVKWGASKPGTEDILLADEADTVAYFGGLKKSRELSHSAVASAVQAEKKGAAADYEARAALREALYGNMEEARAQANPVSGSVPKEAQFGAALALALTGERVRAEVLADDLARTFPDDTIVHFNYMPVVRAQLALNRGEASKAIELLQEAAPYEFGAPGTSAFSPALYPIYVRGNAYLEAHQGSAAASEFQKILDHRGIVRNEPIGALAHLGLGRAYALQAQPAQGGEAGAARAKARVAYQEFLTLWKDADPDIPILKQATEECAKLQ